MKSTKTFKIIILLFSVFFNFSVFSQSKKIEGNWLLTQIKTANKVQNPYYFIEYTTDGKMLMRGMPVATWKQDHKSFTLDSRIPDINGQGTIIRHNRKELVIEFPKYTMWLQKFDKTKLAQNKEFTKLLGIWKLQNKQSDYYLRLKDDLSFVMLQKGKDISISTKGEWLLLPQEQKLLLSASLDTLRGMSKLVKVNDRILQLQQNGIQIQAVRYKQNIHLEPLDFTEEDFSEEMDDTNKLPWKDNQQLLKQFNSIDKLQYLQYNYSADIESFITKDIVWDCSVDLQENSIRIVVSEIVNDKKNQLEIRSKDSMTNRYNHFFPEKDIQPFKVVSTDEKITVSAGTYSCTLVEGIDGNTKYKYWMINDKPGLYAKIIKQSKDMFENISYQMIELNKI